MTSNLVLSLGSNLGDRKANLKKAVDLLNTKFIFKQASKIYESKAIGFTEQPDFYNQVIHYEVAESITARQILARCREVEIKCGRIKSVDKGPRTIDIDILFIDDQIIQTRFLQIPHPSWKERSFVVRPLQELAVWKKVRRNFPLPQEIEFQIEAFPLK